MLLNRILLLALFITAINACKPNKSTNTNPTSKVDSSINDNMTFNDIHSFANTNEVMVKHLDLDIKIDFTLKRISGTANWTINNPQAQEIIFDTKHLDINQVLDENGNELEWKYGVNDSILGVPLIIQLANNTSKVQIKYGTTKHSEALMWLDKEQTADKESPFLFTQSQAILARTWIPCQDGPGVRFTYNATVEAPKSLLVAMSATNPTEKNGSGIYQFKMEQPIPSYLMALVCGDLVFKPIGERTGVYAEPSVIEAASYELADMQKMLESAEEMYGPYSWEQFDVVFLPPSFPFGGMENPRLTFATPTIIAGDRSLTALIAHELAHSWSGNLVTNATWDDFWLNEGFTVYFEQRIMEKLYGREYAEMLALLSYQGLLDELEVFKNENKLEDTHLKLDLKGRNPDDGLSAIAYDKGYLFLRMLEESYGREKFDAFLKKYFTENSFKVMTTDAFIDYLNKNLLESDPEIAKNCQIDAWIFGAGLPSNCPIIKSDKFQIIDSLLVEWKNTNDLSIFKSAEWSTQEWLHFIKNLPSDITVSQMENIDEKFGFTQSSNAEILGEWFKIVAQKRYEPGYEKMDSFLVNVGRRKFLTPIYEKLLSSTEGTEQAKNIYNKARPNYHAVSRETIDALLRK